MQTFRQLDRHLSLLPAQTVNALTAIEAGRGRQEAFRRQSPMALRTLREIAMIQSVEASNAIEDIVAPKERVKALVLDKTTPVNRSEAEIAGYRRVLAEIHTNGESIPLTVNVVLQLHGWLLEGIQGPKGKFKTGENEVVEIHPDGTRVVRFRPVKAADTPRAMDELHDLFDRAWHAERYHRLLLLAAYAFDFLMIHPFQDGNGRMSRLITSLLLHRGGYEVGRYVSWEKLVSESRQTYYESLQRSTAGWHEGEHDLQPWLSYFLGVLVASYKEFEARSEIGAWRGSKTATIEDFVRNSLRDVFTIADVRQAAPGVSDVQIGRVLRQLKAAGAIERVGSGRGTSWRRLKTDF